MSTGTRMSFHDPNDPLGLIYTGRHDLRDKPPCNCHRLRKTRGYPPAPHPPRLPEGKTWGDWCACMCEVHGGDEKTKEAAMPD